MEGQRDGHTHFENLRSTPHPSLARSASLHISGSSSLPPSTPPSLHPSIPPSLYPSVSLVVADVLCIDSSSLLDLASQAPSANVTVFMKGDT
jgi:hypothetical protein